MSEFSKKEKGKSKLIHLMRDLKKCSKGITNSQY